VCTDSIHAENGDIDEADFGARGMAIMVRKRTTANLFTAISPVECWR
jgi:hypothetical protein